MYRVPVRNLTPPNGTKGLKVKVVPIDVCTTPDVDISSQPHELEEPNGFVVS
jgi:hypothetical protein